MRISSIVRATLGAAIIAAFGAASAQTIDIGKREFESSCATCHGVGGTGNGPMAGYLSGRLPDLTTLAKRNNGVFPFNRVYEIIDGRQPVAGHGTAEMPVWGAVYSEKAAEHYVDFTGPYNAAAFARGRVIALTEYVYRLQAK